MTDSEYRQHVIDTDGWFTSNVDRNKVKKSRGGAGSDTPTKPVGNTTTEQEHIEAQKNLKRIHQLQQQKIEMDILNSTFQNKLDILKHETELAHNNSKWELQQAHEIEVERIQAKHADDNYESQKSIDERDDGDMKNDEALRARNEMNWGTGKLDRSQSMQAKRPPSMNANP
jgi:hypothetical protein